MAPANQTKESEVPEVSGKESGTGSGTPFACKDYTKPLKGGVPELIPDSFPESREPDFLWFGLPQPLLKKTTSKNHITSALPKRGSAVGRKKNANERK